MLFFVFFVPSCSSCRCLLIWLFPEGRLACAQAKTIAIIGRGERRLALEQLAEARHVAVTAALDDLVETELRGFQQCLGALDAQMLDVPERARAIVRPEMPQQAAFARAAVRCEPRHADLVLQLTIEKARDFFRQ